MQVDGKTVKIVLGTRVRNGHTEKTVTLIIDDRAVVMTDGEWSRLISNPD